MNRFSRFGELPVYYYFTFNNRRSVGACHSQFSSVVALISSLFPMGASQNFGLRFGTRFPRCKLLDANFRPSLSMRLPFTHFLL